MTEWQLATKLDGIRADHMRRYEFAISAIRGRFPHRDPRVIDAGCGGGYGSYMMGQSGFTVTALDHGAPQIKHARTHYAHDRVTHHQSAIGKFAPAGEHDAVVAFEMLEHVNDAPGCVARLREWAPWLVCSVPNQDVVPFDKNKFIYHKRHYRPGEFEALLTGYEVVAWLTQKDTAPGIVVDGRNGRTLIAVAKRT